MKVLLPVIGTSGDVFPTIGLGVKLKERGHQPVVMVNAHFEPSVRKRGLDFVALGEAEEYRESLKDPEIWDARKGVAKVLRACARRAKDLYALIARHRTPGQTVVVASALAFGARLAQEKLDVPTATLFLQPTCLRSVHEPPVMPQLALPAWTPAVVVRGAYRLADAVADRYVTPELNAIRATLDLPPVKRILNGWWHSPDLILGMFPDWYARPQPDWPAQVTLAGFPLFDDPAGRGLSDEARAFLDDGDPPVVFTPGSGMYHGGDFFRAAVDACASLGRRAMLMSEHPDHLPDRLPPGIRHFAFEPFTDLLPRAAAAVHHGGIGSLSQAVAAGIPQLLMPMNFDQPDNAKRLRDLGIGDWLAPSAFKATAVAEKLRALLEDEAVRARCRGYAERIGRADGLSAACAALEAYAARKGIAASA